MRCIKLYENDYTSQGVVGFVNVHEPIFGLALGLWGV